MQKINDDGEFVPFTPTEMYSWLDEELKDVDVFTATLIIVANGVTED